MTNYAKGLAEEEGSCQLGGFFCHACAVDKPVSEQSPDPRYCQGCYDFLVKEAEKLPDSKHPKWVPRAQSKKDSTDKNSGQKVIQVSQDVVLNMHTVNDKKIEVCIIQPPVGKVTRKKRGPKHRELPEDLIRQWASKGTGSKAIATRLKRDFDIKVHYSTIQRLLAGQRACPMS